MGDEPIREYGSHTHPFDEEHLAKARRTLTKAQSMDWLADGEDGHKTPCIPANDLEWLFGYVDSLRATLATTTDERDLWRAEWEGITATAHELAATLATERAEGAEATQLLLDWVDDPSQSLDTWWERVTEYLARTEATAGTPSPTEEA